MRPKAGLLLHAAVLDKSGQVFEPAICGSLRVSLSESGFYGSRVRGIRTIEHTESHQEVMPALGLSSFAQVAPEGTNRPPRVRILWPFLPFPFVTLRELF